MEAVTKGRLGLGLHLIGWKEVAAGLWMLLLLMELASTCPDQPDKEIPCPLNELVFGKIIVTRCFTLFDINFFCLFYGLLKV